MVIATAIAKEEIFVSLYSLYNIIESELYRRAMHSPSSLFLFCNEPGLGSMLVSLMESNISSFPDYLFLPEVIRAERRISITSVFGISGDSISILVECPNSISAILTLKSDGSSNLLVGEELVNNVRTPLYPDLYREMYSLGCADMDIPLKKRELICLSIKSCLSSFANGIDTAGFEVILKQIAQGGACTFLPLKVGKNVRLFVTSRKSFLALLTYMSSEEEYVEPDWGVIIDVNPRGLAEVKALNIYGEECVDSVFCGLRRYKGMLNDNRYPLARYLWMKALDSIERELSGGFRGFEGYLKIAIEVGMRYFFDSPYTNLYCSTCCNKYGKNLEHILGYIGNCKFLLVRGISGEINLVSDLGCYESSLVELPDALDEPLDELSDDLPISLSKPEEALDWFNSLLASPKTQRIAEKRYFLSLIFKTNAPGFSSAYSRLFLRQLDFVHLSPVN